MTYRAARTTSFYDLEQQGYLQQWLDWFTAHGIEKPEDIASDSTIICDDDDRTLTYDWIDRDLAMDAKSADGLIRETTDVTREITIQLESPALPFPPGQPTWSDL